MPLCCSMQVCTDANLSAPARRQRYGARERLRARARPGAALMQRRLRGEAGARRVRQDVWHGGRANEGEFLHSPLLEELKSLELNLGAPGV